MKHLVISFCLIFCSSVVSAQWMKQTVDTKASFRGLSVVNEKVVWASGTGGTVIKTVDGGKTWKVMTVPGAEKLDFRDIEAFDANTAYILSIGNGESSRIYKTTDGGTTWKEQFRNTNEKAFFDAIACWDRNNCLAMSDPVDSKYVLIETKDGTTWTPINTEKMPAAKEGEAAFAASGTCLVANKGFAYLVSGGKSARVFRTAYDPTNNLSVRWFVSDAPIASGSSGTGIFSIAIFDCTHGVIVGGNYEKPNEAIGNLAFSSDCGETWTQGNGLSGYRSGVSYIDKKTIVAVGTNGTDITRDRGKTWRKVGNEDLNAVAARGRKSVWAVGPKGGVYKFK